MPRNDIDVYLQPLVKDLKELWCDGMPPFDSSKNEIFRMHAALIWTIYGFQDLAPYLDRTHILVVHAPLITLTLSLIDSLMVRNIIL